MQIELMVTVYSVAEGMEGRTKVPREESALSFTARSLFTLPSLDWMEILKAFSLLFPSGGTHWRRAELV